MPRGGKSWSTIQRSRARRAALARGKDNPSPPKYLPTPDEIADACDDIQQTWSDEEAVLRANGIADGCEPYGLDDWMLCPECHKISAEAHELFNPAPVCRDCVREEAARLAGRICRSYHIGNPLIEIEEIEYHGRGTNRSDNDVWWYGLEGE